MNICQHVPVLFLLLLVTAQAIHEGEVDYVPALEEWSRQGGAQEGDFIGEGEASRRKRTESFSCLNSNINSKSTLEEVNRELMTIRDDFCRDDSEVAPTLEEINDQALTILSANGYLENDLLSLVDKAIEGGYYAFLKSLYPATIIIWWNREDLAMLLAKAFGQTEWMSEDVWKECRSAVNWNLRFRSLIRSKNANVYENQEFRDLILKNEIFKRNFQGIIKEAHDSGNTAFLKVIPYPSKEFPLEENDAVFFWSLAYGQEWCSEGWRDYISTVKDIDRALEYLQIFNTGNPKVFGAEQVRAFLGRKRIDETLMTAVEWDSPSFAEYLGEKYKRNPMLFKRMVNTCASVRTRGRTFGHPNSTMIRNSYSKERLSRVYNFLLEKGRGLERDIDSIKFPDAPILDEEYLQPLLDSGFDKVPTSKDDFELYGSTKTGTKFLEMILKGEYKVDRRVWEEVWTKAWTKRALSSFKLYTLDIEAFNLINENLGKISAASDARAKFYRDCVNIAIWKGNVKFLTDAVKDEKLTFDSIFLEGITHPVGEAFKETEKGNFAILDWIFEARLELLNGYSAELDHLSRTCSRPYVPHLKYFFERSEGERLLTYRYLAEHAKWHLLEAIDTKDPDHYNEVRGIERIEEVMMRHKIEIPAFPVNG